MTRALLYIVLLMVSTSAYAQKSCTTFTLQGEINMDSGRVLLLTVDKDYYPYHAVLQGAIHKGRFSLSDSICYPTIYRIGAKQGDQWTYMSGLFFIEPGRQSITCDTNLARKVPRISNYTMKELDQHFQSMREQHKAKELGYTYTLSQYAQQYPQSYIPLWLLADAFSSYGYMPSFDTVYSSLPAEIQQSYTGIQLAKKLQAARKALAKGSIFPALVLPDTNGTPVNIRSIIRRHRYTLVDFWFSHCYPCRRQFPDLKKLHGTYNHLSIIGISTDDAQDIPLWKHTIVQEQVGWTQVLDTGGKTAHSLSVNRFPTNYLLDANGKVIQKDISATELEKLLKKLPQ